MTALQEDSFDVAAIGRQHNSKKETMPAFSFGSAPRDGNKKVFISKAHETHKGKLQSPGPVYQVPTTLGDGLKFGFGSDEQRKHFKAMYPDSSVDLTCAEVDSQPVKFHCTKGVHFGTEARMNAKNAEIIRTHPGMALGMESPGGLEYSPDDKGVAKAEPEFSFGPKVPPERNGKVPVRIQLPLTGTPRRVGPGSHAKPSGMGAQPDSKKGTASSWTFGGEQRFSARGDKSNHLLNVNTDLSSMGRQVVSSARSSPQVAFGTSTRDHSARTFLVTTEADRGPAAQLGKANFNHPLPPPEKLIPKAGM